MTEGPRVEGVDISLFLVSLRSVRIDPCIFRVILYRHKST